MAIKSNKAIKISQRHLLGIQDLSINDVNLILDEAHDFIKVNQSKNKKIDALRGKTQINLFFEPSTRTQSSFELAGKRLGADVTGLDASAEAIKAAKDHAAVVGLNIDYRIGDLSTIPNELDQFDVGIASEVIEHVPDPKSFIEGIHKLISPGGKLIITTLHRSLMSLLGAKIFAEYVLKIVPVGTHDWRKFIKPSELNDMLTSARFKPEIVKGITYSISEDEFQLATNPVVNYAVSAFKC